VEELLFCDVCHLAVDTKEKIYLVIKGKRPWLTDEIIDSSEARLHVWHLECSLIPETLATLPPEQARQIAVETLANLDGFGYTLNWPALSHFRPENRA
jgi:hypothetical protein